MRRGASGVASALLSESALAWLLLVFSIAIAAGLVYVLAERPPFSLGTYIIYPGTGSQTTSEFLVLLFLYALAVAGLLLVYEAPRYRSRPNLATMFLVTGIALAFISVTLLLTVYGMK
ncbi:OST3/OST6 family protein [Infirmifilum sp. NZ]|uniref:OST3/OST6 family protein n=1 Tax=Infirmifilum sp. NZ TaxID=2926850 RepID=UPI0027A46605|nr:OST3/OST6 family protein [Infirmifilum sp. NZ]UNQ72780.1 OST3/OST6 family protein [Infirmifilum sp. NZ]